MQRQEQPEQIAGVPEELPIVPEVVANEAEAEDMKQAPSEVIPVAPPHMKKIRAWEYWTS